MEKILETAGPIGGLLAIVFVVGAAIAHFLGHQISISRETVRTLRVALEHDPSPGQQGQALQLWPEAAKYSATQQRQELVKQATKEEGRRADRHEMVKGYVRVCLGLAFLGIVVFIASKFIKPAAEEPVPVSPPAVMLTG